MVAGLTRTRKGYAVGALLVIAGVAGMVAILVQTIAGIAAGLQQIVVPGEHVLELDEPGEYTIFYEYESVIGDVAYSTRGANLRIACDVARADTGEEVVKSEAAVGTSYSIYGRMGRSVWTFSVERPGPFRFTCVTRNDEERVETVLAIGKYNFIGFLLGVLGAILIILGGIGGGITLIVLTAVARERAAEAMTA